MRSRGDLGPELDRGDAHVTLVMYHCYPNGVRSMRAHRESCHQCISYHQGIRWVDAPNFSRCGIAGGRGRGRNERRGLGHRVGMSDELA